MKNRRPVIRQTKSALRLCISRRAVSIDRCSQSACRPRGETRKLPTFPCAPAQQPCPHRTGRRHNACPCPAIPGTCLDRRASGDQGSTQMSLVVPLSPCSARIALTYCAEAIDIRRCDHSSFIFPGAVSHQRRGESFPADAARNHYIARRETTRRHRFWLETSRWRASGAQLCHRVHQVHSER